MNSPKFKIGSACVSSIRYLKFACAALVLTLVSARAATITWTNTAGGNWNNTANWNPNQVPGAIDTAIITTGGAYTVTLNISPTVGGLILGATSGSSTQSFSLNGFTFTLAGPATVNSRGSFTVDSGSLSGTANSSISGTIGWTAGTLAGTLTLATNGTLNISGGNDHNMPNCTLTNLGTVAWSGGRIRGGGSSPGTRIYSFGLWDAQNDQVINNDYGGSGTLFSNAGTFRKSGGTGTSATALLGGVVFNNTGTLDVQTNLLSLQGGGSFTGGTVTSASGLVQLVAGTFTINGAITTTNVQLTGGVLVGTNVLEGGFNWIVGAWNGSVVTISSNSVVQVTSNNDHNMANCTLSNLGTVTWTGGRIRGGSSSPGTFITNFGLWDAQSDQVINNDYGGNGVRFSNAGTFRKSGGTGTSATALLGGVVFNNTGTLDVQANLVSLQGGGDFTGGSVTGSGLMQLAAGAYTINGSMTTTNVQLTGGTLVGTNVLRGGFNWIVGQWNGSVVTVASNTVVQVTTENDHNLGNCIVTNLGTMTWTGGRIRGGGGNGTFIYNFGLWDAQSDQVINNDYGGSGTLLSNAGTFRKSGGTGTNATALLGVVFNNTGTLDVQTNLLSLQGGGSFTGGTVTSASGLVQLVGGGFTINGTITTVNVQLAGGTLVGTNVLRGGFNWTAGAWNGSVVTVANNSLVQITSNNDHNMANCIATNFGTVAWTGGRIRGGGSSPGTFIYNFGLWDAQSDQVINNDYGGIGVFFSNAATFRKSGGTGTNATALLGGVVFNNTGTVDAQVNLLSLQGGGSFTGGMVTSASGLVQLVAGGFTINGTITTINVQLAGGALVGTNVLRGGFNWIVGAWNGSVVTVASDSLVQITSNNDHNMANCIVTNFGTVAWTGGRIRGGGSSPGTFIYNFGLWDAQSDQVINNDYGGIGVFFSNWGMLRKSGGTGATSLLGGVAFNNQSGAVEVDSGQLSVGNNSYLQGGGRLTIKLGGPAVGQFGQLITGSSASLGGPFSVSLANGFVPVLGNVFQILASASRSNTFTSLQVPTGISVNYSNNGVFLVITGAVSTLEITGQPTNQTVAVGEAAMFTASATGTAPLSYQWQKDGTNLTDGGNLFGSSTSVLTINNVSAANVGTYAVTVMNAAGSTLTSSNATLALLSCLQPPSGLVSWWPGDGNANDIQDGNSGILSNGVAFAAGKVGQAFSFDGIDDRVEIANAASLNPTTALTLDAWVNPRSLSKADSTVVAKSSESTGQRSYGMWISDDGRVHVEPSSLGTSIADTGPGVVPLNTWTHVAAVITAGVGFKIYVNGVEQSVTTSGPLPTLSATPVPVTIGNSDLVTRDWLFSGLIDEVEIFNRALSALEIQSIFNAGGSGQCKPTGCALTCPANIVVTTNAPGQCGAIVTYPAPTASGGCGPVTCAPSSGSLFPVGNTIVSCTTSNAGSDCLFTVTVNDTQPPAIACPANIVRAADPGRCSASNVTYAVTATDNCPGVNTICTPPSGSTFQKGLTTVNCTATDIAGNTNQCSFTVTVNDTQPPGITCPANIVRATDPGQCTAANVTFTATATDNCPGATTVCTPSSGTTFPKGVTTVKCVATDAPGNTNQCSFTVTVTDTEPPIIVCPANVVTNVPAGQASSVVNYPAPTVMDNCPGVTASCAPPSGSAFSLGATAVTCTGRDTGSNTTSCSFTVAVNSSATTNTPPTITCPANITTNNTPDQCSRTVAFALSATGNPAPTVTCRAGSAVITSPNSFPVGTTTVTCTASNVAGVASCSFTVTVNDTQAPTITCPERLSVQCDADVPAPDPAAVTATDNCAPAPMIVHAGDVASGTCPKIITRTYKATDTAGNMTTCTQTIAVRDTNAPVISGCQDMIVSAPIGQLGTTASFAITATDSCDGTVAVSCTPRAGGYFAIGQTPVTCTAVDRCGNQATCSFTVTVTATTDVLRVCSFTQGFYGNANGKFNGITSFVLVGQLLGQGPLIVGKVGVRSLSILAGDSALLQQRMPSGGPSAALPNNGDQILQTAAVPLNAKGRFANVFLGQTITLSLNLRLSAALRSFGLTASFCSQAVHAGPDGLKSTADDVLVAGDIQKFSIPASVLNALLDPALGINDNTVLGLLKLANCALAGLPTGGASLSDINAAVDAINRGFDECRAPVNCSSGTVTMDSFNDNFTNRPALGAGGPLVASGPNPPPPPPDGSLNIQVRSSNLDAVKEPGEPDIAGNPGGKSVWWKWNSPISGPVTISTVGSSFDTLLGVYTGTAFSNLVLVASSDDAKGTLQSEVGFQALAGTEYQIAVDGNNGASGEIVLTLVADPPSSCLPFIVSAGRVKFCFLGEIGRIYTVEASPDLINWTLIATAVNSAGELEFNDPAMSNFQQRYYRVTFEP